ncbi:LysR family transcriptional regulator [Pseudorhodoferax sp.]|uniref:LysR family transcriptional regulator n=1 Tax=Pseudorhodoferax sp. TaxID=1993553 RepID=UPI002DD66B1D|nr:LysR family transcriptional regulator [Pseudorhodoferax sp.]
MDLRQLSYFVAVAEERHLGRAAERLHLTQPPLTRKIKALEAELGAQLFERTARGMLLTQAGEVLLSDARNIFGLVHQAADRAHRAGTGLAGRLDVGLYGSAVFGVVPQLLRQITQAYPQIEISLHHGQTPQQVAALRQGRVLIVFERLLPKETDLAVELVAREPLFVAMGDTHPLASREAIDVRMLKTASIVAGSSPAAVATILKLCRDHGFEPNFAPPAGDVVMATLVTAFSEHITLVPMSMTNVNLPGVTYRPLKSGSRDAHMEIFCFYRKDHHSAMLHCVLEIVRAGSPQARPRRPRPS